MIHKCAASQCVLIAAHMCVLLAHIYYTYTPECLSGIKIVSLESIPISPQSPSESCQLCALMWMGLTIPIYSLAIEYHVATPLASYSGHVVQGTKTVAVIKLDAGMYFARIHDNAETSHCIT